MIGDYLHYFGPATAAGVGVAFFVVKLVAFLVVRLDARTFLFRHLNLLAVTRSILLLIVVATAAYWLALFVQIKQSGAFG